MTRRDEERLPEGMKRVGYDSDTARYYFEDADGATYIGPEGAEFGQLVRVSGPSDEEAAPRADGYQPLAVDIDQGPHGPAVNAAAYRTLSPFFLLIAVVLLLVYRLIVAPATSAPQSDCPGAGNGAYWVQPGDSCWSVAGAHGCSLEVLRSRNPGVDCERLMPGTTVCLPRCDEGVHSVA